MEDALRRGISRRKRAAALRCAAKNSQADPKLIKLMLETAAELETEAEDIDVNADQIKF